MQKILLTMLCLLMVQLPVNAMGKSGVIQRGDYLQRPEVQAFIAELANRHEFSTQELQGILGQAKKSTKIIELISKPAEGKPWHEYREIFLGKNRINAGVTFWKENREALEKAETLYGVPAEIIVAIIGVETFYGTRMGKFPVLDALMTLGFDYPPRAKFFRAELEQFLLLSREENIDPRKPKGSYAGAMGMGQFIPSSFRNYAIDFDADGKRDIWHNPADGIGSVAHYFHQHGWRPDQPVAKRARVRGDAWKKLDSDKLKPEYSLEDMKKHQVTPVEKITDTGKLTFIVLEGKKEPEFWIGHENFYVITRYNHSKKYAMAVFQLSQEILKKYRKEKKVS